MSAEDVIEFDEGWDIIHGAFLKLVKQVEGTLSAEFVEFRCKEYMEVYRTVYKLCSQKSPHHYPQQIYDKYGEAINEYITEKLFPPLKRDHAEFTLEEFVRIWENYKLLLQFLSNLFNYLDRYFVRKESLPSLTQVGITAFRDQVYLSLKDIVKNLVIHLIYLELNGERIDRSPLKGILNIYVDTGLDLYKTDLEEPLLEIAQSYYSRKAEIWISELSVPEYLIKVEESLENEANRVKDYLHSSSSEKLAEIVRKELLSSRTTALVENEHSGLRVLLRDYKEDDILRFARLLGEIPEAFEPAAQILQDYATQEGVALIEGVNVAVNTDTRGKDVFDILEEQDFDNKIVALHRKAHYLTEGFKNNDIFQKATREAFQVICNKRTGGLNGEELYATIFRSVLESDNHLKFPAKDVAELLKYLYDKDAFINFYREKLADRLLFDKSSNVEDEKALLEYVKTQIRLASVGQLEEMLNDIELAGKKQDTFKQYIDNSGINLGIDVTVKALRHSLWSPYHSAKFIPPLQLTESADVFNGFYSEQHANRKLNWAYALGTANVIVQFEEKAIEITASTLQASVLLLFSELEDSEKLSFEEIKSQTKLEGGVLESVLRSLVFAENYKILLKEPENETIAPTDRFELNLKFTNELNKIRIPFQRSQQLEKKVNKYLEADRRNEVRAAIVRIMKNKKVLPVQILLRETADAVQHRFKATDQFMLEEIEYLTKHEYLEKGEDPDILHFYFKDHARPWCQMPFKGRLQPIL